MCQAGRLFWLICARLFNTLRQPAYERSQVVLTLMHNPDADSAPLYCDPEAPPHARVIQIAGCYVVARAVHVLAQLAIADHLKDGPRSSEEIAQATGTHAPSLYRLLRLMARSGFFVEDDDNRFSLTTLGAALRTDAPGHARSTVLTLGSPGMWRAFGDLLQSVKTGEPALGPAREPAPFYDLGGRPEQAALLNETMIGFHGAESPAVAAAYDFSGVKKLVDVGGGTGTLLTTILLAYPDVEGLLYDLPHVIPDARRRVEMKGLSGRCEVMGGNFFESVPRGGNIYVLSNVIHDWDEGRCLTILGNCRRAMPAEGKLLLVEQIIPPGDEFHPGMLVDLIVLATTGGKVRTEEEHAALLANAGFRVTRVIPTQSPSSIIEAVPA